MGNRAVYSVLDGHSGLDRPAVLHGGEFRLFGRQDFIQRFAHNGLAAVAGMARPGRIGILTDDAAIGLHGHEDKIHR